MLAAGNHNSREEKETQEKGQPNQRYLTRNGTNLIHALVWRIGIIVWRRLMEGSAVVNTILST